MSGFVTANNGEFEAFLAVGAAKWVPGQDVTRNFTNFKHAFDEETGEYIVEQPDAYTNTPRGGMFPSIGFMHADRTTTLATASELLDLYDIKLTTVSSHHGYDEVTCVYTLAVDPNRADSFFIVPDAATAAAGAARRQGSGRTNAQGGRYLMADFYPGPAEPLPAMRSISKTVNSVITTRVRGRGKMVLEMVRKEGPADPIRLEYKFRTTPEVGIVIDENPAWGDRQNMLGMTGHTTPANNALYLRGGKTVDDGKVMLYTFGRRTIQLAGESVNRSDLRNTLSGNESITYHTYDQAKSAVAPVQSLLIVFGMASTRKNQPFNAQMVLDEYDGTWEFSSGQAGIQPTIKSGTMRADPAAPRILQFLDQNGAVVGSQIVTLPTPDTAAAVTISVAPSPNNAWFPGMARWQQTANGTTYTRVHGLVVVKMTLTPKKGGQPLYMEFNLRTNPLA